MLPGDLFPLNLSVARTLALGLGIDKVSYETLFLALVLAHEHQQLIMRRQLNGGLAQVLD